MSALSLWQWLNGQSRKLLQLWDLIFRDRRVRSLGFSIALLFLGFSPLTRAIADPSISTANVIESAASRDSDGSAEEFVVLHEKLHRLEAENRFLERELFRLEATTRFRTERPITESIADLSPESQKQLLGVLNQNYITYLKGIEIASKAIKAETDAKRKDWLNVRIKLNQGRNQVFEATAQGAMASRLAQLLNVGNRWLWFCAVVGGGVLAGGYWFHNRHYYRRLFWVRKSSLLRKSAVLGLLVLIPAIPTIITFVFGNKTYESLLAIGAGQGLSPRQAMQREIDEERSKITQSGLEKQNEDLRAKYDEALSSWLQLTSAGLPLDSQALSKAWIETRNELKDSAINASLLTEFNKKLVQDTDQQIKVQAEIDSHREAIATAEGRKHWNGAGLGAGLLIFYSGLGFSFCRRVRRQQRETARTCPRCLAVGKLELASDAAGEIGGRMGLRELCCKNIIRNDPYEECEFTFNVAYSDRIKIGFPTLGVSSSGKTHWLAMVYRELNKGRYPSSVHFEKIKGKAAEDFDKLVDLILGSRISTAATKADRMPHPLIFNFRDNDRISNADLMVSIFDYAGQVLVDDFHFHRSRALNAQGYFFFLDPTKPDETQVKALLSFREDLRLSMGLKAGEQLHVPVALCISKLDLLVGQSFARGSDIVEQFYQDLREIDQGSGSMTLDLIERRSELIGRLREVIWPGWNIERQIHDLFGERYMFFPLTPVGLDQPGVTDLSQRNIEPYAILEPLLWLLHMNGYPVLENNVIQSQKN